MEALPCGLEVSSNWKEPTACLHPQPGSGPAGDPLFRVPWPSAAFPTESLKALMAPGQLLSLGSEDPHVSEEVTVPAQHPTPVTTVNVDEGLNPWKEGNMG